MARPRKNELLDLSQAVDLTAGAIERLVCPVGMAQAFLRDAKAPGLRVRVTTGGAKSYVFEAKLNRQNIRRTIGDVRAWTIEQARQEANRLRVTLDTGDDPRELERQQRAAAEAKKSAEAVQVEADRLAELSFCEVWQAYLADRRAFWGARHYADHLKMSKAGGEVAKLDKAAGRITLKHDGIKNLDMPPMLMAFRVRDPNMLDGVVVGDRVRFVAERVDGQYTLVSLSKAP